MPDPTNPGPGPQEVPDADPQFKHWPKKSVFSNSSFHFGAWEKKLKDEGGTPLAAAGWGKKLDADHATGGHTQAGQAFEALAEWMICMYEWGKHVRQDILKLEKKAGISHGDPGDPPPPPWGK